MGVWSQTNLHSNHKAELPKSDFRVTWCRRVIDQLEALVEPLDAAILYVVSLVGIGEK